MVTVLSCSRNTSPASYVSLAGYLYFGFLLMVGFGLFWLDVLPVLPVPSPLSAIRLLTLVGLLLVILPTLQVVS